MTKADGIRGRDNTMAIGKGRTSGETTVKDAKERRSFAFPVKGEER